MIMDSNPLLQDIIETGASYSDDLVKDELIKFIRSGFLLNFYQFFFNYFF